MSPRYIEQEVTQAELDAHIADSAGAHAATAISVDSTNLAGTGIEVQTVLEELDDAISAGGIPGTIVDAVGDIITATAADTPARLAVGADGTVLTAASGQPTGLQWAAPAAPSAASDTASGIIELAIQSEMETGTDVVRAVTPGRQHFHPSAAKCWVASTQSSTTIQESYNVASVADTGTGISTVTIATDFAGTTYCVVVGAEHNSASGTTQTYQIDNGGRAAGTYIIQSWQVDGTEALTDPSASWFSVAFGDQA